MARITYLGEGIWPSPEIEWEGEVFPLGQAVWVDDPTMIRKAAANPHFKVEDTRSESSAGDPPEPAVAASGAKAGDDDEDDEDDDNDDREEGSKRAAPRAHRAALVSRKKK